jgi:hypothetical protein
MNLLIHNADEIRIFTISWNNFLGKNQKQLVVSAIVIFKFTNAANLGNHIKQLGITSLWLWQMMKFSNKQFWALHNVVDDKF